MAQEQFDVVIVGSGAAGLFCAIAAQAMGLRCVVLEKAPKLGGGTAGSAGLLWVGANHLGAAAGIDDSVEEAAAYLRYVGADGLDPERMQTFVTEAPRALAHFERLGLPFRATAFVDHYYGVAPGGKSGGRIVDLPPISADTVDTHRDRIMLPAGKLYRLGSSAVLQLGGANSKAAWQAAEDAEQNAPDMCGAGAGLVVWLVKHAIERGVVLRTDIGAERLISHDGRIVGVVTKAGAAIEARRGVVIASGGYESNPDLVRVHEGLPGWQSMFPESLTGDGLIMAMEMGAAIDSISNNLSIFLGFRNPDENSDGVAMCRLSGIQELIAPHTIVVNRHGKRFGDETFFQALAPILRSFDPMARELSNLPCYLVFDQQYVGAHSFAGREPGAPIPPWVKRATTLPELASQLDVEPAALEATMQRFNGDVASGSDAHFRRGETSWGQSRFTARQTLGTIQEPPFYGIELHPTALSSVGLRTDVAGRVLSVRNRPMPGLYAIGNAAARKETGSGYQTGFSLGSAMTFGLLAAHNLVATNQGE
jgi:3-oxosteroid 1-dehydrogenase